MTETDIPPGGEGKIEVTFDSGHKMGQQKKTITVESNDPVNPKANLYVSALIEVQFGFELYGLDLGRIRKGETATKTAVLILKDQSKRNLLNVSSQSPYITVKTINSTGPDKSRIEVQITVNPKAPAGQFNESVTAKLTDNSQPASNLSVRGTIVGNIEVTPETVHLTADTSRSAADQAEQLVRVVSTQSDVKFRLLSVTDPSDQLSLEVDTVVAGEQYVVRAKPNEKALGSTRNVSGEIRISTNDTDQPMLTCRYTIIIPRK